MTGRVEIAIALPAGFRAEDILAFHRRDAQEIAERVTDTSLCKGMLWEGIPACLTVRFGRGVAAADIALDGETSGGSGRRFEGMVRRMLGLEQGIEAFEELFRADPGVGPLIAAEPGLRVPVAATPFEALSWAVTGQQISVGAAVSLRRRLIGATAVRHSSGLLCYPDAQRVAALDEAALRGAGFSTAKARTLLSVAQMAADAHLPLDAWVESVSAEEIRAGLLAVRGIGPWTVDYVLLRGFGWLDGSLHGDVAVRRGLQLLLGSPDKLGEAQARAWLERYSPWRALVAAHLWRVKSAAAY